MSSQGRGNDDQFLEILDAKTYSVAEAARLVSIHPRRAARWLQGYSFDYDLAEGQRRHADQAPVVKRVGTLGTTYASFLDLIDLLFVKQFLDQGISLQKVRLALDEVTVLLGAEHFARQTFFTDGRSIYLQLVDIGPDKGQGIMQLMTGGQWTIAPIIQALATRIDFHEATGYARRWFPLGREGHVVVDPFITFGRPSLFGRGVATENVYDFFLGEQADPGQVSQAFGLPPHEVMAAISFEQKLAA